MNMTGLSLEQAPPFASVARFFVTAPIFGAIFGLFVFINGDVIFDRFAPQSVAMVHLFTIGFVMMAMFGALAQMLPVLAGIKVPKFHIIGLVSYLGIVVGCAAFFAGFYFGIEHCKKVALCALFLAVCVQLLPIIYAVLKAKNEHFTVRGMALSMLFGLVATMLGFHLLSSYAFGTLAPSHYAFVGLHIVLAIFGFAGLLIVSVANQVLPMFFVAPKFPKFCNKFMFVFAASILLYAALVFAGVAADIFVIVAASIFMLSFGVVALKKLSGRRRKVSDISLKYWQFGLAILVAGSVVLIVGIFVEIPNSSFVYGLLFGIGFLASIIKAMLNKIVPFLVWFHLTSEGNFNAPNINELLPQRVAQIEFVLHILAFICLVFGLFFGAFVSIGGLLLAFSFSLLAYNLFVASRYYKALSTVNL